MKREKALFKNTFIILIGKVCTQLITFLLLPLYTSILTVEEYGLVDFLNTIVSLCLPIITLQIEQAIFRELVEARENENLKKEIISTGIITVALQCAIFLIIFFIFSSFIKNTYKNYIVLNVLSYIVSSVFLQISRGLGDNKRYTIGSCLSALSTIIFNILFIVAIKLGARGMLLGTMIGQIINVCYLFIALHLSKYISFKHLNKKLTEKLLKYSTPLIPNAISWWIFNASDRVIVTTILGIDINGILAASLKFSTIYIMIYNVYNISWTESISIAIRDKDVDIYFNRMFDIVIRIFIAFALIMISCMPFVYPVLINKKFMMGYNLVPLSIISSFFNVIVGLISVIYVGKKNTKAIANTSIWSAIINIIVHLLLIKVIGLYAAVLSTMIAFLTMSIYRIIHINKLYFKIKINKMLLIKTFIYLIIIMYMYYLNKLTFNILSLICTFIYSMMINKKTLNVVVEEIKRRKENLKRNV